MRLIDANIVKSAVMEVMAENRSEELFINVGALICKMLDHARTVDAVILPCKIGDTVWTIMYGEVREAKVNCIRPFVFEDFVEFRGNAVITMEHPYYSDGRTLTQEPFIIFGKDTFLTREEAETALAEMRETNEAD